jgi:S-DNA-T family DNA segregation ATPase FtsK/SpoIIIE
MATRALTKQPADWRAAFRRSAARAGQIAGAGLLLALLGFLALSLLSYTATDPSPSTAASGVDVRNWMGHPGAWMAERLYLPFGLTALLLLPMLYGVAMRLWRAAEAEDGEVDEEPARGWRRWRPFGLLLAAMAGLGTVLTLVFDGPGGSLPAGYGGLAGLVGAQAVSAIAAFAGGAAGWITLALALVVLAGSVALLTRVFAIDWARYMTLPAFARQWSAPDSDGAQGTNPLPREARTIAAPAAPAPAPAPAQPEAEATPRRAPTITDPSAAPRRAAPQPQQNDMFAEFALPPLDLLTDAGEERVQPLDKVALERNARLLENVLDDFNVKGEITAVRTGPVVTMYELEPAPASRPAAWSASPKT